ncbi:endonuclease/exonuclease/phosphatase family protein [Streptomyces sp. NPDC059590]|uniref:endonuclease/exonuclease/phosphatase family protein n=1 Tax=Streptomyces sp. NPDC059590 TaxID=3346877 RepID=UPI00369DC060
MRRFIYVFLALCGLIAGLGVQSMTPAFATDVSGDAGPIAKSAGQKWALKSLANGKYVSVEMNDTGANEWRMRARSSTVGSWERFTLRTNHFAKTISLRSEATGYFATAEFTDAGEREGMLRARGANLGSWQQYEPSWSAPPAGAPAGSYGVTLKSVADGYADRYWAAGDDGTLRATAASPGTWGRFVLEPVPGGATLPPAGPTATHSLNVMTWNVCADHNANCGWSADRPGYAEFNEQIRARLADPVAHEMPDVIFFQEFCEKYAKHVEEMLEQATQRGWDVRFAPIHNRLNGPLLQKQCAMGPAPDNVDRGSFGVAIAVPDENTFYERYDFTSPPDKEQRTALCAAIPSRAVMACTAHLSAGRGYDDNTGEWRTKQAKELRNLAAKWEAKGYRPVFGGDLNVVPPVPEATEGEGGPSTVLMPVYDRYLECSQLGDPDAPRSGAPTSNANSQGKPMHKIDYIFAPKTARFTRCAVSATSGKSDHWTLYGTVALPAA